MIEVAHQDDEMSSNIISSSNIHMHTSLYDGSRIFKEVYINTNDNSETDDDNDKIIQNSDSNASDQ